MRGKGTETIGYKSLSLLFTFSVLSTPSLKAFPFMADETIVNGVDPAVDSATHGILKKDRDLENDTEEVLDLKRKIEALEEEKSGFITEKEEQSERIKMLMVEIEGLKKDRAESEGKLEEMQKEVDRSEEDKKVLKAVAARAADLETEVSRLQHDLISAMSESEEASAEVLHLKKAVEELEKRNREKDSKIGSLENEKASLLKKMEKSTAEMGSRIRDLEQEGKDKVSELLRKLQNEKEETEAAKSSLEEKKKRSDERSEEFEKLVKELKSKNSEMEEKLVDYQVQNSELEDRVLELEKQLEKEEGGKENDVKEKSLKFQWPAKTTVAAAAAASTGTVAAAAAMIYLKYARQR